MREIFIDELVQLSRQETNLFLCVGDLGFGVIEPFAEEFPERFINAGVAEQSMSSLAAGLASEGNTVFTYSIANFPTFRALEQIRNDIAYHRFNVVIVAVGAGVAYGSLGYSHHAIEDLAVMRAIPGIGIYSPSNERELRASMRRILREGGPAYLRLGKATHTPSTEHEETDITLPRHLRGLGEKLVLTTGEICDNVLAAVAELPKSISEQLSVFSVPYLGYDALFSFLIRRNPDLVITIEEHRRSGGLGSLLLEIVSDSGIPARVERLGFPEVTRYKIGSRDFILGQVGLHPQGISSKIEALFV